VASGAALRGAGVPARGPGVMLRGSAPGTFGSGGGDSCAGRRELGGAVDMKRLEPGLVWPLGGVGWSVGAAGPELVRVAREGAASGASAPGSGGGVASAPTRRAPETDELSASEVGSALALSPLVGSGALSPSDGFHCNVVLRRGPTGAPASLVESGDGGGGGVGVSRSSAATGGSRLLMGLVAFRDRRRRQGRGRSARGASLTGCRRCSAGRPSRSAGGARTRRDVHQVRKIRARSDVDSRKRPVSRSSVRN
jgi:hypothetical protein